MVRRLLATLLTLLVGLVVVAKVQDAWHLHARWGPVTRRDADPRELTLSPSDPEHGHRVSPDLAPVAPLDSVARASARILLGAEVERHYLDSLFTGSDSTIRRWPNDKESIALSIEPGGAAGFQPEMVSEVRQALDTWSPASVGLLFLEQADTVDARMIVRWTDTLEADRAGATDVTWDKAGRIHRVTVYLAVRSPSTGRPFTREARRAIVLHELGHALGLPHSSHPQDVMYPVATATTLSDRDRFSLRLLYELPTGWIGSAPRARPR
jgi:Matrixin